MAAVLNVDIIVNDNGSVAIRKFSEEAKKAEQNTTNLSNSTNNLSGSFSSLSSTMNMVKLGSFAVAAVELYKSISEVSKKAIESADTFKLMEGRLSLVAKSSIELASAQQELFRISQETRQGYKETVDLYTSLARSTQQLGKSQKETLAVTSTINKAIIISGSSAESAKAALVQLGQGFASGTLRGDELNSVLEQTPRIAEAIAKGMGTTVGELRTLGAEGKLTGKEVFEALQKQAQAVDEEFGKMPKTVGQATTQMSNSWLELIGVLDKATGISAAISDHISENSKKVSEYAKEIRAATQSIFDQNSLEDVTTKANQIANEIEKLKKKIKGDGSGYEWYEWGAAMYTGAKFMTDQSSASVSKYTEQIKRLEQQMEQLGNVAVGIIEKTNESTKKGALLTSTQVKEQVEKALSGYEKYYQAIGDNETLLQIKKYKYSDEYKDLTQAQIKEIIDAERNKLNKTDELNKEWAKRKTDIAKNISIAEQDELAKPYIELETKYNEDLAKYKSVNGAKEQLTKEFTAQIQRLNTDTVEKVDKKQKEEQEKQKRKNDEAIELELKLQEERFRIQSRYINLLDDETDRNIALAYLEADRNKASLKAQLEKGKIDQTYYDTSIAFEEDLLQKQLQRYTVAGQVIYGVSYQMTSSFENFFDYTSDGFMKFGALAKNILHEIYMEIVKVTLVKPLVSSLTSSAMSYFGGATKNAVGGVYASDSLSQYSNQVVDKPTFFAFATGGVPNLGVMGEAGAEAILPLTRTASGDLGVQAVGGSSGTQNIKIEIVNESGQDMQVTNTSSSFDTEGMVLSIVVNGIQKNKYGLRDLVGK